ncbi:MAG: ATP-binding protein [Candidatus Pseudobacter hemicellulosilyticus]|uniref:histidine kinase n=1 Tax=Candidatus Pseudobacter hemicellulosilyticus TaxID=3121375 RepID=A0AAJ6BHA2_9BACT|nr:MAG: ATP-binding protein [Pseudobacter sp.]
MTNPAIKPPAAAPEFLSRGGELGQLIMDYDWSATPLGPVHTWPQSLRTCMRIMLTSRQPMWIGWGQELIKLYNDPYKAIAGGKHPWALGMPASVVWKDVWRDIEPMLRQVMEKDEGTYVESQLLIMERNGYPEETYYTFSYTPIPGDEGGTAGMLCANTDDTDRIISERQLRTLTLLGKELRDVRNQEELVRATLAGLADNAHDFTYALFYTVQGQDARLSGSTDLGTNHKVPAVITLQQEGRLSTLLRQAAATGQCLLMDHVKEIFGEMPLGAWPIASDKAMLLPILQAASDTPYGFLVAGFNPYRLPDEKYSSFFSLVADQVATSFAEVHVLEEDRKRAAALAEIDRAKTIFFSNISHEFRTPLTLLLGPIEEALSDPRTIPENKVRLEFAWRNTLRMQKLVNTLLEFSRIEAGRVEGLFTKVDIGALTRDLASSFRSAIEKAGMQLQLELGPVTAEVYVDTDMWEKIILNLVSNAFKYTREGLIRVTIQQQDNTIVVAVEDTGIGIDAAQLDKIFERFHRIENVHGRSQEGTGIGLAMVKELVNLQYGVMQVTSEPGKGSIFTVILPTGRDHLPADKIAVEPATAVGLLTNAFVQEAMTWLPTAGQTEPSPIIEYISPDSIDEKKTVLLADDNADMRDYICRLLSDQFRVVTARDGEEAFQLLLQVKPDLLLTDVMMPGLDGFGLLKKVRAHTDLRNLPVIFLSARAGEEAKVEGLDAGADDYMIKPFSARELLVRVGNMIRINQVRREMEQQLYLLFLQAPAIINVFKGPEFRYELYHPKNKELFGDRDFTGLTLLDALPELSGQGIEEQLSRVYWQGETIRQFERQLQLPDEQGQLVDRYFNLIFQPWYDLRGKIQGVLNFAIEVTETVQSRKKIEENEKNLEAQVQQRTIELQRSNEDLQQFAHVASHDLKEPVRKVRTFISRLQDEYAHLLPERGQLYMEKVEAAAGRMVAMIEGVLQYALLNEPEHAFETVNLNEVLDSIEADLEVLIQQRGARIIREPLPAVQGVPILLYQLFYNLVNNSLKFAQPGVPPGIQIRAGIVEQAGGNQWKIDIQDNGIGFDQHYADKIFDSFTRLHSRDKYEGTGLGLALCKKIVQRHHGSISAVAQKNNGALFSILLPFQQPEQKF